MGEVVTTIFKSAVKISAIFTAIFGFLMVFTVLVAGVTVALNKTVIIDVLTMMQFGLPFNLDPVLLWLGTSVTLYITYRLAIQGYTVIKSVIDS